VATVLIGLMVALEIVEGHASHLALVGIGLVALAVHARFVGTRRILGVASACIMLIAILAVGSTHWFAGHFELLDGVYALVLLLVLGGGAVMVFGRKVKVTLADGDASKEDTT
jgi:hypothetical protein